MTFEDIMRKGIESELLPIKHKLDLIEKQLRELKENLRLISQKNPAEDPWEKYAGMFADDPDFDDVMKEIEAYRKELDEAYWKELDNG